jgi:SAM-dependent methyltransferase
MTPDSRIAPREVEMDRGSAPRGEPELETVACDLCGSTAAAALLSGPDRVSWRPGTFHLVRCGECGLIYQNPRPTATDIVRFYEGDYHPYIAAIEDEPSALRRWRRRFGMKGRCRLILDRKPPGHLLDVGCGTGIFLDTMRGYGWQVQGVELNADAARYSRERLGLEVFSGPLEAVSYADGTFDVVTLWDVLEHLPSPRAAMDTFRRILKPDGLLVFRVPNAGSLDARLFGAYWAGWDLPRHYYVFDQASVQRLLRQGGFEVLDVSYGGGHPPFVISAQWWMDDRWQRSGALRRLADRMLANVASRLLSVPYFWLAGSVLKRGAVMTIVARQGETA